MIFQAKIPQEHVQDPEAIRKGIETLLNVFCDDTVTVVIKDDVDDITDGDF